MGWSYRPKTPTYDEILDEYRYDCEQGLEYELDVKFVEEHPTKNIDWNDIYRDQSIHQSVFGDRVFTSFHLKVGLKRIEGFFTREIRCEECKYSKEDLTKMIENNPHLHNIIKTNLLVNLNNRK